MKTTTGSLIASSAFLVGSSEAFGVIGPHPVAFQQPRNSHLAFATVPDRDTAAPFSSSTDAKRQNIQPEKIKSNVELTLEEKAELRVELGMEKQAELSVEKAAEDAANQQYAASLLSAQVNPQTQPSVLNIDEVQDFHSDRSMTSPIQVPAESPPVQIVPEPVQKKKQYTPEELRAFEIAAERSVEREVEMNVERAAEVAAEKNSFSGAEALGKRMVTVDPVADVVARRAAPGAFINPVTKKVEVPKVEEARVDPVAEVVQEEKEERNSAAEIVDKTKAPIPTIATLQEQLEKQRQQCLWLTRKQPKSKGEEAMLQTKYGSMDPGERAFAILLDLEMIILHPDPASSSYDRTFDNDFVPSGEWV